MFEKKERYALRKSKVGTVSALIGISVLGSLFLGTVDVHAAEDESASSLVASSTQDPKTKETVIKSPVDYIADPTKDVGVREEKTTGQDGKLIFTTKDKDTTVERIEPTKTEVVLGTKPKVEGKIEKAKTEYVEDNTLEGGTKQVVTEAKDGEDTTTTTYKIVVKPKVELDKKVEEALTSDKYMYTDEKLYSVDESKELPSDKIIIDKLFVGVPTVQTIGDKTSIRETIQIGTLKVEDGSLKGKVITPEMLDPNNPEIRKIKYQGYDETTDATLSPSYNFDYSKDKDLYFDLFQKSYFNLLMLSRGNYLNAAFAPGGWQDWLPFANNEDDAIKRYFARNILTESIYADAKGNYLRLKFAEEKLNALGKITKQDEFTGVATNAFNSLTQMYNAFHGYDKDLNIQYVGNIPEEVQKKYKEELLKLPYEIRKNLGELIITTENLQAGRHTDSPIGNAYPYTLRMMQKYEEERKREYPTTEGKQTTVDRLQQPEALLDNFMHEISHIIDFKGGYRIYHATGTSIRDIALYGDENWISNTKEFRALYDTYLSTAVDYKDYYKNHREEAFADTLGEYINKKIYGVPYTRYKNIGGTLYEFKDATDSNYATAFSPLDIPEVEAYFATIYTKLFEQPTEASVVVDTITRKKQDRQDGLVKVGTKPKEETIVTPFTSTTRLDATLAAGLTRVLQAGVNGETLRRTTYALNKATGDVTATTADTIVKQMLQEIVLVGTKVEDDRDEKPTVKIDEKTVIAEIPYRTIEQQEPTLRRGERVVKVRGQKGRKEVKTTQFIVNGQVLDTKIDETILDNAVDEIILIGTLDLKPGQTVKRVEVRTARLPFKTITRTNPSLAVGQTRLVQAGVEGSFKVVRDDIYQGENLIVKGIELEIERIEATDEIIEVGTKKPVQDEIKPPKKEEMNPPKDGMELLKNGGGQTPRGGESRTGNNAGTGKSLPNTGDNSRVARQLAFGGYGLLASLGLAGVVTKRKRGE